MSSDEDESVSPQRGNRVDSINYYRNQLTELNNAVEAMQKEKKSEAEEGNDRVNATEWISNIFRMTSDDNERHRNGLIVGFSKRKSPGSSFFKQVALDFFFGGFTFLNRNISE